MDEVEKMRRLMRPTCVDDYHLGVNLVELVKTEEGKKLYQENILPWLPYDVTVTDSKT